MGQDDWIDGRLSMAEEVVLLTLDDATGEFRDLPPGGMGVALGGAMLMDLALADRIDSDLTRLFAVSQEPTGDEVLDGVLGEIARKDSGADDESTEENPDWGTFLWVEELARRGDAYRDRLLDRLVGRGVLRIEDTRVLWVFGSRAYPPATGIEGEEVRARLREAIFGDEIPEARDILLIGLANATGILGFVLDAHELIEASDRIAQITALEEISRSVTRAVYEVQMAIMGGYPT